MEPASEPRPIRGTLNVPPFSHFGFQNGAETHSRMQWCLDALGEIGGSIDGISWARARHVMLAISHCKAHNLRT
jgi:hypothetical protein